MKNPLNATEPVWSLTLYCKVKTSLLQKQKESLAITAGMTLTPALSHPMGEGESFSVRGRIGRGLKFC